MNQNYNRYDKDLRRIGVIYKNDEQALEMFNTVLKETEHQTRETVEWFPQYQGVVRLNKVMIVWDFTKCEYMPKTSQKVIKTLYSFHKMVHERDVHNVAGMHFRGFHFCDSFTPHTLNYLMSRLRVIQS